MTCQEVDFLRELDLFDFPEDKVGFNFAPSYSFFPQNANVQTQRPRMPSQIGFRPTAPYDDILGNFNVDFDDKCLFDFETKFEPAEFHPESLYQSDIALRPCVLGKRGREVARKPTQCKKKKLDCDKSSSELKSKTKQKRTKWMRKEVQSLWQGIALFGNNWRLIKKKAFAHRTYYQVKDKGRRILSSQGWSSGRTKATHDGAAEEAKMIAEKVLAMADNGEFDLEEGTQKARSVTSDSDSNVSSTATIVGSEADEEFDLDFKFPARC